MTRAKHGNRPNRKKNQVLYEREFLPMLRRQLKKVEDNEIDAALLLAVLCLKRPSSLVQYVTRPAPSSVAEYRFKRLRAFDRGASLESIMLVGYGGRGVTGVDPLTTWVNPEPVTVIETANVPRSMELTNVVDAGNLFLDELKTYGDTLPVGLRKIVDGYWTSVNDIVGDLI